MYPNGPAPISCSSYNRSGMIFAYAVSYDWSKGYSEYNPQVCLSSCIHPSLSLFEGSKGFSEVQPLWVRHTCVRLCGGAGTMPLLWPWPARHCRCDCGWLHCLTMRACGGGHTGMQHRLAGFRQSRCPENLRRLRADHKGHDLAAAQHGVQTDFALHSPSTKRAQTMKNTILLHPMKEDEVKAKPKLPTAGR